MGSEMCIRDRTGTVMTPQDAIYYLMNECVVAAFGWNSTSASWTDKHCATIAGAGEFTIPGLDPEREYRVHAVDGAGVAGGFLVDGNGGTGAARDALELTPRSGIVLRLTSGVTMRGAVELPPEAPYGSLSVSVRDEDGLATHVVRAHRDEPFEVPSLNPRIRYTVELVDALDDVVGGFYAGESVPLGSRDGATLVLPTTRVTLRPTWRTTLEGALSLTATAGWDLSGVRVVARVQDPATGTWVVAGRARPTGSLHEFSIEDLRPAVPYRVQLIDDTGHFVGGYLTASGALGSSTRATTVTVARRLSLPLDLRPEWKVALVTRPVVSGRPAVGSRVAVTRGTWSATSPTITYQWLANGDEIDGATAASYTIPATMLGLHLEVRVRASAPGLEPGEVVLDVGVVDRGTLRALERPRVLGTARVGQVLRPSAVTWSTPVTQLTYRWYRDGAAITGATGATYKATRSDVGHRLTVIVTAHKRGYRSASVTSLPTATVQRIQSTRLLSSSRTATDGV